MKKAFVWILAAFMLLSLCGCDAISGYKELKEKDLTDELLCQRWRMEFYIGEDELGETYFVQYELDVTLTQVRRGLYSVQFSQVSASMADGAESDVEIPEISGTTIGNLEGDQLVFQIPTYNDVMMHTEFVKDGGVVYGFALEHSVAFDLYYSLAMYLP